MFKKILSLFREDPEIEFYSIVPGLEEINQPILAYKDSVPNWVRNRSEKTKETLKNINLNPASIAGNTFFVEKCPGIRSIMNEGIHLKTWQDIKISLISNDEKGEYLIHSPTQTSSLTNGNFISPEVQSHNGDQFPEFIKSREDSWPHILKIMSNWRVNINKNWQLLLLPTYYSNESPLFSAVPGIFNPEFGSHLNINIQIHKKAPTSFIIPAGTSIVKLIPIKKNQNFDIKIRKVTNKDIVKEQATLALLKKRFITSRKEQLGDLEKMRGSIKKCPFFN